MKKITIEEHFAIQEQLDASQAIIEGKYPVPEVIQEEKMLDRELPFLYPSIRQDTVNRLLDMGEGRLQEMDNNGIDMQVLSLVSPGVQVFDAATGTAMARKANDRLAEAVSKYPKRFAGFASVAPQNPSEAAKELERAVKELGLKGVLINSHTKGEYLDDKKYWVILEMAERLDVPVYIHPRCPSPDMIKPYLAYRGLASAILGFAAEVSLHAVRLICSGVFDQFPRLNIILGHCGEAMADRQHVAEKSSKYSQATSQ
jgi:2,3-dihydroxybenzoate decarboxylase